MTAHAPYQEVVDLLTAIDAALSRSRQLCDHSTTLRRHSRILCARGAALCPESAAPPAPADTPPRSSGLPVALRLRLEARNLAWELYQAASDYQRYGRLSAAERGLRLFCVAKARYARRRADVRRLLAAEFASLEHPAGG